MAQYEWKQTIFTPDDFNGAGQYIVREGVNKTNYPNILDTSYLSTVMMKVGYIQGGRDLVKQNFSNQYCLIDMSDGLTRTGYFIAKDENGKEIQDSAQWKWISFSGETNIEAKQVLCDYLNNNPHGTTFRKATNEELIRVAAYQKLRTS